MKHLGTKNLETKRFHLRPFTKDDAKAMYKNWTGDTDVTMYVRWKAHRSLVDTQELLFEWTKSYSNPSYYNWAIVPKEGKEPIGNIAVHYLDERSRFVEIGYCISKSYWNQGVVTEVFKEVIRFLFDEIGINRIQASHDTDNKASGKVMEKCGLQYEGILRSYKRNNLGIRDITYYAILKEDYDRRDERK